MNIAKISAANPYFCGWRESSKEEDKRKIAKFYYEAEQRYGNLGYSSKSIVQKYKWLDANTPNHDLYIKDPDPRFTRGEFGFIVAKPKDRYAEEVRVDLTERRSYGGNETLLDGFNRMIHEMEEENEEYSSPERIAQVNGHEIAVQKRNQQNKYMNEAIERFIEDM